MVGGPAKANDLGNWVKLLRYQDEAAIRGVGVKAYFAEGTPQNVIDFAIKKLGTDNVVIFNRIGGCLCQGVLLAYFLHFKILICLNNRSSF